MTTLPVSEAKARLNELARLAHARHERFALTRIGRAEAVLLSVDDLEGLELEVPQRWEEPMRPTAGRRRMPRPAVARTTAE